MTRIRDLFSDDGKNGVLFCFSPAVMLATFIIEFFGAIYTLILRRETLFNKIVIATLICLGLFQVAEYQICGGALGPTWAKIGLAAIVMLPALGMHLVAILTKQRYFVVMGYIFALAYAAMFLFAPGMGISASCEGNYVIVNTTGTTGYGYYYIIFLVLALMQAATVLWRKKHQLTSQERDILIWTLWGYLSFMGPMAVVYAVLPEVRNGTPSIMCGFAVMLALILTFVVAPKYHDMVMTKHKS